MRFPNKQELGRAIEKTLDWGYDAALAGGPGFQSIEQLAVDYMSKSSDASDPAASREAARAAAERLVRWQIAKAGATGFVTGLPGLPLLPITIPANISAMLVLHMRMVGAIATIGGYDPHSDQAKTFVTGCLAGEPGLEAVRQFGVELSKKLATQAVKQIPGKVLISINQKVGFRLATKFGEKGLVNLGKGVPLVGGVVGGAFDAVSTRAIGKLAIKTFIDE